MTMIHHSGSAVAAGVVFAIVLAVVVVAMVRHT
jgi:tetrahydromethanopterin S-methyltransferase subunit F